MDNTKPDFDLPAANGGVTFLWKKSNQKSHLKTMYSPFSGIAMWYCCSLVACTVERYC